MIYLHGPVRLLITLFSLYNKYAISIEYVEWNNINHDQ